MPNLPDMYQMGVDLRNKEAELTASLLYTDETATGVTKDIGDFKKGDKPTNLSYQEAMDKFLHPYVATTNLRFTSSDPAGKLYEKGTLLTLRSFSFSWTPGSTQLDKIVVYNGVTTVAEQEIASGSTATITITETINISSNTTYTVKGYDNSNNNQIDCNNSINITFADPYFYGVVEEDFDITTLTTIDGLTKVLSTKYNPTYSYNLTGACAIICYPASYGELSTILDPNGFDVTGSFIHSAVNLTVRENTQVSYIVYKSAKLTATGYKFTYKF